MRRLLLGLGAAGLSWAAGCAPLSGWSSDWPMFSRPPRPSAQGATAPTEPTEIIPTAAAESPPAGAEEPGKALSLSLDTVLRLAEEQSPQIALARERLRQSGLEGRVAQTAWLPNLYVGSAYYRHEGGIQDQDGRFIHSSFGSVLAGAEVAGRLDLQEAAFRTVSAERKVWQQKGELSKVASETLLDAANTYIDLLAARTGEAVAAELGAYLKEVLQTAEKLAQPDVEPGTKVQLVAIQSALSGHQQAVLKLRQQGDAAAAKLAYLLGLGPFAAPQPLDPWLTPIDLVDAGPPAADLVARALSQGPGVKELEGLLAAVQGSLQQAQGLVPLLPVVEMQMLEGGFAAGPGARLTLDNRWDLGLQARWNLTDLASARDRQRVAHSRLQQLHLSYQDLRGKLAAGVREAHEAVHSGRQQIELSERQVEKAREAYKLSEQRLKERVPGSSPVEVLQAIRAVEQAQLSKLQTVRDYDKAQVRLLLLLGPAANGP